jgi:hypothetical protein
VPVPEPENYLRVLPTPLFQPPYYLNLRPAHLPSYAEILPYDFRFLSHPSNTFFGGGRDWGIKLNFLEDVLPAFLVAWLPPTGLLHLLY